MLIVFQDFDNALAMLTHGCGVMVENGQILIKKSVNKYTTFFSQMFEPFLLGYWVRSQCGSLHEKKSKGNIV